MHTLPLVIYRSYCPTPGLRGAEQQEELFKLHQLPLNAQQLSIFTNVKRLIGLRILTLKERARLLILQESFNIIPNKGIKLLIGD